jgi:molybdopterin-binding protein
MEIAAELKNITKTYGDKTALANVNLQVREGEILALLGPNGSGKTTILKILALIESPTTGELQFLGETVTAKNMEKNRMLTSLVFQKTTVFTTSVYNNVAYGLKIRKIPREKRKHEVKEALKLVKLEGFENRPAKKLSGGEQQRVAIARALVLKTKLLLLDEPTANLDPKNSQILEEVITTVNRETKTTIVMATHNMFQARLFPHRIALVNDGRISEIGKPEEVFGRLSKSLVSFVAVDNTFKGNAFASGEGTTIIGVVSGVEVEAATQKIGEVSFFVSPQDIVLSNTALESSARNVFKGKITEISDLENLVKLKVDVGVPFTVQITKRSFVQMALNLNAEVYIAFKASSVQVL